MQFYDLLLFTAHPEFYKAYLASQRTRLAFLYWLLSADTVKTNWMEGFCNKWIRLRLFNSFWNVSIHKMFPLMMECRPTTLALFKSFMSVCTYLRSLVVFLKYKTGVPSWIVYPRSTLSTSNRPLTVLKCNNSSYPAEGGVVQHLNTGNALSPHKLDPVACLILLCACLMLLSQLAWEAQSLFNEHGSVLIQDYRL